MFFIGFLANTLPQTMGPVCWFGILHDLFPPPPRGGIDVGVCLPGIPLCKLISLA